MSNIYQDVLEGGNPLDALDRHAANLDLPIEYEDILYKRTRDIIESAEDVIDTPSYPSASSELIKQFTDNPVPFPVDEPAPPSTVTAAGSKRPMVPANYSKMSDDQLLANYESAKLTYQEQLKIDPEGKAFMPTARGAVEGYEKELAKRGIDPSGSSVPKIEAKVSSDVEPPTSRLRGTSVEAYEKMQAKKAAEAVRELSPAQQWAAAKEYSENVDPEQGWKRMQEAALASTETTKKSIEESGYLYHYAPREYREAILSEGLMTSKARTAALDAKLLDKGNIPSGGIYFFTNPEDAPSANVVVENRKWNADASKRVGPGADLYRIKIEPGMLEDMVVDAKLPIRDDAASAVILSNKDGAFKVELVGEDANFGRRTASYTPIKVAKIEAEKAAETAARTGGPLKVGEAADISIVHSARETTEKLKTTARVADAVSSDGAPAKIAAEAVKVLTGSLEATAAAAAEAGSRAARATTSAAKSSMVSKAITSGHKGSIGLGVAAAGLLLGAGAAFTSSRNKRADRSAAMNAQQRYRR